MDSAPVTKRVPKTRKQKLVSVCSVEHTSTNPLKYMTYKASSGTTKMKLSVTAPINEYNLLLLEMYPDSKTKQQVATLPCNRLNFVSLCCSESTRAEDVLYDFAQEYKYVKSVDFTGHVGSMRLAFDLLKNFPRLRKVVFVVNDYNAKFPYMHGDTFQGLSQCKTVESVRIFHDLSVVEKSTLDVQNGTWRLDEFLQGCHDVFPNLKHFEVNLVDTGSNYKKINEFISAHSQLNKRYTVEISNDRGYGKVKTRHKQQQRPTTSGGRKARPSTAPPIAICDKSATTFQNANIPNMSLIKKEVLSGDDEVQEILTQSSVPVQSGFSTSAYGQEYQKSMNTVPNQPNLSLGTLNRDPRASWLSLPEFTFPAACSSSCSTNNGVYWPQDKGPTCSGNQSAPILQHAQPLSFQNVTALAAANGSGMFQRRVGQQSVTPDSAYSEGLDQEQEDTELNLARLQGGRNPSPPPRATCSQVPVTNSDVQFRNADDAEQTCCTNERRSQTHEVQVPHRVSTTPLVTSTRLGDNENVRKLVPYSVDPSSQYSEDNSDDSSENINDPRLKKRSRSRSRSSTPPPKRYSPK